MPMGPIELADTVGLDICLAAGKALAKDGRRRGAASLADQGRRRAARQEDRSGHLPLGERQGGEGPARRLRRRRWSSALIEPYLREARRALAEGIVADADLVDAGLIFGTGFAPFRGGPLHYLAADGQAAGR